MGALNVLGGLAQGYNLSREDEYRRQEQEFLKLQRQRMLKEQADEDALKAEYGLVRPAGTYNEEISAPDMSGRGVTGGYDSDAGDVKPTKQITQKTRTQADVANELANIAQKRGKLPEAMGLRREAMAVGEYERQQANRAKREQILAKWKPAFDMLQSPEGIVQATMQYGMPYYNQNVKDGQRAALGQDADGTTHLVVYGPDGKPVEYRAIDRAEMREFAANAIFQGINHELGGVSDEDFVRAMQGHREDVKQAMEGRKLALEGKKVEIAGKAQEALARHYEADDKRWEKGGVMWQLKQMEMANAVKIANIQAAASKGLNPLQQRQLDMDNEYDKLMKEYIELAKDPKANFDALQRKSHELATHRSGNDIIKLRTTDPNTGQMIEVAESKIGLITKRLAAQAGVTALPHAMRAPLEEAATRSRGDKKRFLASPEVDRAVKTYGVNPDELAAEFLGTSAAPTMPSAQQKAMAKPSTPAVPYGTKDFRLSGKNLSNAATANAASEDETRQNIYE